MALPSIVPYSMPSETELPANKAAWIPDPNRAALLIHDMQQYFVDAFQTGKSPMVELLANIKKLRARCTELGIPVIFSAQPGGQSPDQRGLLQDFWGAGINDGPYQKEFVSELVPKEEDIVVTKWRYSAFQKTNLLDILRERGRDQLIVCGIYAHIGCLMTSCEAFMQDVQPFLIADAVADFSADKHRMALTYAAERCAVTTTTERVLDALNRTGNSTVLEEERNANAEGVDLVTQQSIRDTVARLLQEEPSEIGDHDNLVMQWGLDSIRIMSLVEQWRRSGIAVSFVELAEQPTVECWRELLSAKQNHSNPNHDFTPNYDYF
ncbi:isochorismatase family protein [Paenibacillus sp. HJL G12]|uniref:isochorismatase n=1 Tax=Paenibacillus dendrobii TaxID=2691084 RepID=A0A7X3INV4_9BACL|nr:isochorismatase family protein [Paenibacillus dendrobii]MWV46110.1 isochorismatase family protein [Paenibacillus dendrobii]